METHIIFQPTTQCTKSYTHKKKITSQYEDESANEHEFAICSERTATKQITKQKPDNEKVK